MHRCKQELCRRDSWISRVMNWSEPENGGNLYHIKVTLTQKGLFTRSNLQVNSYICSEKFIHISVFSLFSFGYYSELEFEECLLCCWGSHLQIVCLVVAWKLSFVTLQYAWDNVPQAWSRYPIMYTTEL